MAEQKCKRIERRDPNSLQSDPNMENRKETSRNKEVDRNRRKNTEGTDNGTNQRQRRENGTDGNSYKTHGNGREQAGMSREGRRTIEKVRENTVRDTDLNQP